MASTIAAGTTSGTAIAIAGDTSGVLQLQTNGTTAAVTIDTSQQVLVGTTTSTNNIRLNQKIAVTTAGSGNYGGVSNTSYNGTTASTGPIFDMQRSRGTTDGSMTAVESGDTLGYIVFRGSDGTSFQDASFITGQVDGTVGSGSVPGRLVFNTNNAERMRITSAGTVLLGTTSTSSFDGGFRAVPTGSGNSMQVIISNTGGGLPVLLNRSDDGNIIDFRRAGTNVGAISVSTTNTAYNTSSDYRLKENIAPMTGALAKITQLKPVTYTWKSTGETSQGFIAHELQAVVPDCVTGVKDAVDEEGNPVHQGIDTSYLVATLTSAIQELKAELDSIKAELATLKAQP